MRWAWLVVLIAGCRCGSNEAKREPAANVAPAAPRVAPSFDALRTDRGLGCVLARNEAPNTTSDVINELARYAPPALARVIALARVDWLRESGESPELGALADAVHILGPLGDVEGLRAAFVRIDEIEAHAPTLSVPYHDEDIAYRARVRLPIEPAQRDAHLLAVIEQQALGGDVQGASALYDRAVTPEKIDDSWERVSQVGALAALGRTAEVRDVIAHGPDGLRPRLLETWLVTALERGVDVEQARDAFLAAMHRVPAPSASEHLLRLARVVGKADALAPIRAIQLQRYLANPDGLIGGMEIMYVDALERGDASVARTLEPMLRSEMRALEHALRTGSLDGALRFAGTYPQRYLALARVWVRAAMEHADASAFAKLADATCRPTPAAPTPMVTGARIVVGSRSRGRQSECELRDLTLRLERDGEQLAEQTLEAACDGACTPADKREGVSQREAIERGVARGENVESELDEDFTGCVFTGYREGAIIDVGGRSIAVIEHDYRGAHGVQKTDYVLAFEACGQLFTSLDFADSHVNDWGLDELKLEATDREIIVRGARDNWHGVLYRAALPICPARPVERVTWSER